MARFEHSLGLLTVSAAVLSLTVAGATPATAAEAAVQSRPAVIEPIAGSALRRVTLTERAAKRIDIQTAEVAQNGAAGRVVPYASIVYDISGAAFVYTNPQGLSYVRHAVSVERINGANAYLSEGPPVGTKIVTVGVPQLFGAEKGIGH